MMMFILGLTATAGAAFTAGRIYENWLQEKRAIRRRKARKEATRRKNRREAKTTGFMATAEYDAPGARR